MKAHTIAGWVLGAAGLFCFAAWRLRSPAPLPVENFELIDRSGSDATPCLSLARTLQGAVESLPSSGWTFFATGSTETAYEPIVMPVHSLPVHQRLIDGKQRAATQHAAFIKEVTDTCNGMPVTDSSPIFIGLKHVIAQARQRVGKADVHVYVITDLQETVEDSIVRALKEPHKTQRLPEPINVQGVKVQICGYAQTIGRARTNVMTAPRTDQNTNRLIEIWSALFTGSVEFVPFCS
jgi:hypothetical protein